ncbi:MAG TPA: glycosyltransferase family 39 protein [Streptosporangiaceae bacterium]|nr:glycosyltransferase family 39 protein [Streptosporangiaceae bacterium]
MTVDQGKAATNQPGTPTTTPGNRLSRWLAQPWVALIPGLTTLAVTLNGLAGPSFTRDESATMLAVHRSFPQLVRMLGNVDVVHGAYYSMIWVVTQVAGSSALVVRFPSAVAAAVTAAMVALLGQRLVSGEAGLAAGLVYAALPPVSGYAEIAREYAVVAALASLASYLLVLVLDSASSRRWLLVGYGVTVAALGLTNIFGLLLLPAHAVAVAARVRQPGVDRQRLVRGWLVAGGAGFLAASPVALVGLGQISQVAWIKPPGLNAFYGMASLVGNAPLVWVALVVIIASVALRAVGGLSQIQAYWPGRLVALAVPWLVLPPALLFTASYLLHPVYVFRYVAFCIPASALLIGTGLVALGRVTAVAGLLVIVALGLPAQAAERLPAGHGYAIRQIDRVVQQQARPGDVLLNTRFRPLSRSAGMERQLEAAYPFGLSQLRDVSQGVSPAASATLGGTFAPPNVIRDRLAGASRVWVAGWSPEVPSVLRAEGFTPRQHWFLKQVWLWLYERGTPAPSQP